MPLLFANVSNGILLRLLTLPEARSLTWILAEVPFDIILEEIQLTSPAW
jgi:hypothetical protein